MDQPDFRRDQPYVFTPPIAPLNPVGIVNGVAIRDCRAVAPVAASMFAYAMTAVPAGTAVIAYANMEVATGATALQSRIATPLTMPTGFKGAIGGVKTYG